MKKKRQNLEKEESTLMAQINELKKLIYQQSVYNKTLTEQYIQLNKMKM